MVKDKILLEKLNSLQFMKSEYLYQYGYAVYQFKQCKDLGHFTRSKSSYFQGGPSINVNKLKSFEHALRIFSSWGYAPLDYSIVSIEESSYFNLLYSIGGVFINHHSSNIRRGQRLNDCHIIRDKIKFQLDLYSIIDVWRDVTEELDLIKRINLMQLRKSINEYYHNLLSETPSRYAETRKLKRDYFIPSTDGRDLWGKRPRAGLCHSTYNKNLCRKIERHVARQSIKSFLVEELC